MNTSSAEYIQKDAFICKMCHVTINDSIEVHALVCPEYFIDCDKCLGVIKRREMELHLLYYCIKSETCEKIQCKHCNEIVPVLSFRTHYSHKHLRPLKTPVPTKNKIKITF